MSIEFFFDIGSPYSYLAATQMDPLSERTGVDVDWRPFLLGGVFKMTGNTMPAALDEKGAWMLRDLHLWADHYNVDFSFSSRFPINSLRTQRALLACKEADGARLPAFARALYRDYWVEDLDVSEPRVIAESADRVGLDGEAIVEATEDQAIKDRLLEVTTEAVERGAFGAPTFFVDDQMFWGNDRLHFVEEAAVAARRAE